jgi:hypothetical protein
MCANVSRCVCLSLCLCLCVWDARASADLLAADEDLYAPAAAPHDAPGPVRGQKPPPPPPPTHTHMQTQRHPSKGSCTLPHRIHDAHAHMHVRRYRHPRQSRATEAGFYGGHRCAAGGGRRRGRSRTERALLASLCIITPCVDAHALHADKHTEAQRSQSAPPPHALPYAHIYTLACTDTHKQRVHAEPKL